MTRCEVAFRDIGRLVPITTTVNNTETSLEQTILHESTLTLFTSQPFNYAEILENW